MNDKPQEAKPEVSLIEAYLEQKRTANSSWSDTDKLYVSVCAALVASAAIFGGSVTPPPLSISLVGILLGILACNWWILIGRYREKIASALDGLQKQYGNTKTGEHYRQSRARFEQDRHDYRIVMVVSVLAALIIIYPIAYLVAGCFR